MQAPPHQEVREETTISSTPINVRSKRKAKKTSPDAASPSSEELITGSRKEPRVILRKVKERTRKRKPRDIEENADADWGEASSTRMSADSEFSESDCSNKKQTTKRANIPASSEDTDIEYTGTEYLDSTYTKKLRSSNRSKALMPKEKVVKPSVQEQPKKADSKRKKEGRHESLVIDRRWRG